MLGRDMGERNSIAAIAAAHARRIRRGDPGYPPQLDSLAGAPPELFVLGDASLLLRPQLAIVGSRAPTAAGRRIAADLSRALVAAGFAITSGLARGIDAAAHEAALEAGGATIAVLGTGLDTCYPRQNEALFERIARHGVLVSEFPAGTGPRAHHFPRRNRIISGLGRGVVVIEAAAGSGSLITAHHAAEQGREVFAVPGSPLNPLAAGCNDLIRNGAVLVRGAADILSEMSWSPTNNPFSNQIVECTTQACDGCAPLDKDYEMLLDALGFEPASIDDLVDRTGLAPGPVASMVLILELEGRVEARPGALYNRVI
jgi:DNA processing protein